MWHEYVLEADRVLCMILVSVDATSSQRVFIKIVNERKSITRCK